MESDRTRSQFADHVVPDWSNNLTRFHEETAGEIRVYIVNHARFRSNTMSLDIEPQ